jgi:hypothetical protein
MCIGLFEHGFPFAKERVFSTLYFPELWYHVFLLRDACVSEKPAASIFRAQLCWLTSRLIVEGSWEGTSREIKGGSLRKRRQVLESGKCFLKDGISPAMSKPLSAAARSRLGREGCIVRLKRRYLSPKVRAVEDRRTTVLKSIVKTPVGDYEQSTCLHVYASMSLLSAGDDTHLEQNLHAQRTSCHYCGNLARMNVSAIWNRGNQSALASLGVGRLVYGRSFLNV